MIIWLDGRTVRSGFPGCRRAMKICSSIRMPEFYHLNREIQRDSKGTDRSIYRGLIISQLDLLR